MSLLIAGSIAIDNIKTPHDSQEGLLGGSAAYAALAASLFTQPVHLCGIVGQDFPQHHLDMLASKGIRLDNVERSSGDSFTWTGEYHNDMNSRTTHKVALNVLEEWIPNVSANSGPIDIAVLANMSPDNQLQTLAQCPDAKFIVADTMDLWINIANERLHDVMKRIHMLVLNESEAKEFAGTGNLVEAGRRLQAKGPKHVVVKRGEHGSFLFGPGDEFFASSAYPLRSVFDPTGAGDCFLGGMMGWLAAKKNANPDFGDLKQAVVHGSVAASFTCEAFSTQRVEKATQAEVKERLENLRSFTSF